MSPSPVCPLPAARLAGLAVQLYALRSSASWGIGDLGDLARLGRWCRDHGLDFLLLSPLHAPLVGTPQEPSPYFASSRQFLNPLYARVDGPPPEDVVVGGRGLGASSRRIDHDLVWTRKIAALERQWRSDHAEPEVGAFAREVGPALEHFAAFCAISEVYGRSWRAWPAELRHPASGSVADFVAANIERVRFYEWVQWLLDQQLAEAATTIPLVLDVAVGTDPAGADAWRWQDALAPDERLGAPPDAFNGDGQDWGIQPFAPAALAEADFGPVAEVVRSALRHAAGLRIDHVMGFSRQWWVSGDASPRDGRYVEFPLDALLDVVCHRAELTGAFVVGEDLGTVEDGLRERLAGRNILSTRVAWFEDDPPEQWPERAMATATTHDLPTIGGVLAGADGDGSMAARLRTLAGALEGVSAVTVAARVYARLAASPCAIVAATIEDALGVAERPNHPGQGDQPNWSVPLPVTLEEIIERDLLAPVAEAVRRS